jgi:hypothetical protein
VDLICLEIVLEVGEVMIEKVEEAFSRTRKAEVH